MSILTNVVEAEIRDHKDYLEGKTLTRPALLYTDGVNVTYAVDVDIGQEGVINANGDIGIIPMRNVPIASNNRELLYAEIDQAVILKKNDMGHWEVVGFGKTKPGTFVMVPIQLPDFCFGIPTPTVMDPVELGIEISVVTYGDLTDFGDYGEVPYGSVAVYENGEFSELRLL